MTLKNLSLNIIVNCLFLSLFATAQEMNDEENVHLEEVIVTSVKATAGGAQDINYARDEVLNGRIPHPETLTAEGLMSQHDLSLKPLRNCDQLFCVFTEASEVSLVSKPQDQYLVGLGFGTNIDAKRWKRQTLNVVAVVDKSGSMSGTPLSLVRTSLIGLVNELDEGDQFSVVLYGRNSNVFIKPTPITRKNKAILRKQIKSIQSEGSTNMEEGLEIGFDLAIKSQENFIGTSRLILFTDERPNVGDTSAESFIGMATAGSKNKVGLTTIGVGVQFDAELATKISSTRGGNLFYLSDKKSAETIFSKELDYMVSELAHDVRFTINPNKHFRITAVYGVPGNMLSWGENNSELEFTVPTIFLSARGGGLFVTMAPTLKHESLPAPAISADASLLEVDMSYVTAREGELENSQYEAKLLKNKMSNPMKLASLLVDQYVSMKLATTEHYVHNNQTNAYKAMVALSSKVSRIKSKKVKARFSDEAKLIARLTDRFAFMSGRGSEIPNFRKSKLWGTWKVTSTNGEQYLVSLKKDEFLRIDASNQLSIAPADNVSEMETNDDLYFIETKNTLIFESEGIELRYKFRGKKLILSEWDDGELLGHIKLERFKVRR